MKGLELIESWSKSTREILEYVLLDRILEVLEKLSIKFMQKLGNLVILLLFFNRCFNTFIYKFYLGWRHFSSLVHIIFATTNMLLTIQLCAHLFLIKSLPSVHHGFYPIHKNRETRQSGLQYLDKFWQRAKFWYKFNLVNLRKGEFS